MMCLALAASRLIQDKLGEHGYCTTDAGVSHLCGKPIIGIPRTIASFHIKRQSRCVTVFLQFEDGILVCKFYPKEDYERRYEFQWSVVEAWMEFCVDISDPDFDVVLTDWVDNYGHELWGELCR